MRPVDERRLATYALTEDEKARVLASAEERRETASKWLADACRARLRREASVATSSPPSNPVGAAERHEKPAVADADSAAHTGGTDGTA